MLLFIRVFTSTASSPTGSQEDSLFKQYFWKMRLTSYDLFAEKDGTHEKKTYPLPLASSQKLHITQQQIAARNLSSLGISLQCPKQINSKQKKLPDCNGKVRRAQLTPQTAQVLSFNMSFPGI